MLPELLNSIKEHFDKGGDIMIPLLLISFVMWVLIIKKAFDLKEEKKERSLSYCFEKGKEGNPDGTVWQKNIVEYFFKEKDSDFDNNSKLMEVILAKEKKMFDRYSATILILAVAAPLLGLLGTVTGMINTFETIEKFGTGNAKALAENISEALITTQTGLIVSIPGLLIGNALNRKSENLMEKMRCFGFGILRKHEFEKQDLKE